MLLLLISKISSYYSLSAFSCYVLSGILEAGFTFNCKFGNNNEVFCEKESVFKDFIGSLLLLFILFVFYI